MSFGKLENFGHPHELLQDDKSIFHDLVYSLEEAETKKLVEIAEKLYASIGEENSATGQQSREHLENKTEDKDQNLTETDPLLSR